MSGTIVADVTDRPAGRSAAEFAGALGARLGGAPMARAALRVCLGGALAMAASAGIGEILGISVG